MSPILSASLRAAAAILLLAARPLAAQSPEPFSTLQIFAGASADLAIGRLADFWDPSRGGLLRLSVPFHFGSSAASVQRGSYRALTPAQPDFRLTAAALEWNAELDLVRGLGAFAGAHVGAASMKFIVEEASDPGGGTTENELLAGIQAGLNAEVAGGLGLSLIATHRRLYTRLPIRLDNLAVGLHYSTGMPVGLRKILE